MKQTPKQKRASERNWNKAQVMSAHAVCKNMMQKGRSFSEKECAKNAAFWLNQILLSWNKEENK